MRRNLTVLTAVVALSASLGMSGPAQAAAPGSARWGYCWGGNPPSYAGQFNAYSGQGYCGGSMHGATSAPGCYTLVGGPNNEWMASTWNRTSKIVTIFQSDNCSFAYGWKDLAPNTSDPDLYPDGLFRNVSSLYINP